MRRVWRLRNVTFVSLLAAAALLLLLPGGAKEAEASPFAPEFSASPTTSTAGAVSDVDVFTSWGVVGDPNTQIPSTFPAFTPADWGMYTAAASDTFATTTDGITIGEATGTSFTLALLGILNSQCVLTFPISFDGKGQPPIVPKPLDPVSVATTPLLDASINNSAGNTIAPGVNFVNLLDDLNGNGVMDGAERWHDLLETLLPRAGVPQPIERQVAVTDLGPGTTVFVDILTYAPGDLPGTVAALGFTTLTVIENFSPALPDTPSLISDSCGLSTTVVELGLSAGDDDGNPGGGTHRTNPSDPGTKFAFLNSSSDPDADNDGIVNNDDSCVYTPNIGSPINIPPNENDGGIGEGLGGPVSEGNAPGSDKLDAACDPNPLTSDGADIDGDLYLNRDDNCPQDDNGELTTNQIDIGELSVGNLSDSIGDDCDLNPTVTDGHIHTVLNFAPTCITAPAVEGLRFGSAAAPFDGSASPIPDFNADPFDAFPFVIGGVGLPLFGDLEGDGWCNVEEILSGSSMFDGDSNPELLGTGGVLSPTCSDGEDNDKNGVTDFDDPKCHEGSATGDLSITKITRQRSIGVDSTTAQMSVHIRNRSGQDTQVELGVNVTLSPTLSCGGTTIRRVNLPVSVGGEFPNPSGTANASLGFVDVPANGTTTVHLELGVHNPCPSDLPLASTYTVFVDICHVGDPNGLGLFGAANCAGANDGFQDRLNVGNDAPLPVEITQN